MLGRLSHASHSHEEEHHHPLLRRIGLTIVAALLLASMALLLLPPHARGNFVYWANDTESTIGRAKINGTGVNNAFIAGLDNVHGVAVDSRFIYWTQGVGATSSIGRANLDGSGVNPSFIPSSAGLNFQNLPAPGIAVTSIALFFGKTAPGFIGRANVDGSNPNPSLINVGADTVCGIAADPNFVYWLDIGLGAGVHRAGPDGSNPQEFITDATGMCGLAVDGSFLYWIATGNSIGRAPVGGGAANNNFIPGANSAGNTACGVSVNPQYVFWGNAGAADFIGRANLNGSSPNPTLISGPTNPCLMAAAPSNKITINSVTRKKKKGTATIDAKVPGPGQVTLNQISTPPDVNATAAAVKQIGLTIPSASSFKLAVKPQGKTAKKLKKQVRKKGKGKVKVKVFIHFVPAGVAGVPNTNPLTVKLIKRGKKK
ncbi:MAG: hypothetical protein ACJ75Z_11390 [Solirubrobacterales bacterium]